MREYCVDLELAEELRDNGFPHKGIFYSYPYSTEGKIRLIDVEEELYEDYINEKEFYFYPTSDEILKELPIKVKDAFEKFYLTIERSEQVYTITYQAICNYEPNLVFKETYIIDIKLPNALAKMWIYLKREGYIT